LGIILMGITIGQMVLSFITGWIIVTYSWQRAYITLAVVALMTAIPAIIILGKEPPLSEDNVKPMMKTGYTLSKALKTAPFWMLIITGFVISAGFYFIISHIVSCAIDRGISTTSAAIILTMSGIGGIAGTLLAGLITLKLSSKNAMLILILIEALAMLFFIFTGNKFSFYLTAILFGFGFGAVTPVRMSMIPLLFGFKSMGVILGLASFAWSLGGITGPFLAGYAFDKLGNYSVAFVGAGMLLIIGAISVLLFGSHR
jgi:predicted MFS family arabinose efflux permease